MFKDDYKASFSKVTASKATYRRIMSMTTDKKKHSILGITSKVLIAAILISALTVTACASETVRNWFVAYFTNENEADLSQHQVEFVQENEQYIGECQTQDGWSIELRSAMADGMKGYVILGITAPENTSVEDILKKSGKEYYGPGNDFLPKSDNAVMSCSAYPNFGGVVGNISTKWVEDSDGLNNTLNYVIDIAPDIEWAQENPFNSNVNWHIHIENLVYGFPEQTIMAEGTWDYDFTFENHSEAVELLGEPIKTQAWAFMPDGTEVLSEVTVTSIALRPFGATVYYGDNSDGLDYDRTSVNFTDSSDKQSYWYVVMKDGSRVELGFAGGNPNERYQYLESKIPVPLEDAEYLLLTDGMKIPIPRQ